MLKDAWALKTSSPAGENLQVASYGRLCVRCILRKLQKEKLGREPTGFPDLDEIAKLFANDLQSTSARSASSQANQPEGLKVENLIEATSAKIALLQNEHLELGHLQLGSYVLSILVDNQNQTIFCSIFNKPKEKHVSAKGTTTRSWGILKCTSWRNVKMMVSLLGTILSLARGKK